MILLLSSPLNDRSGMLRGGCWGWPMQVFVGDGKLCGISVMLTSLEELWSLEYQADAIVFVESCVDSDGTG